ncbi:uncharacterized protein [Manis javanica]|uniref:uncharacterized protein isoform X10 n=1 Tax=Manis javanica TaxID=9974 RepID=UPI003C6CE762
MWTLRSPLTRSRYVDMTSGPGGRKENHQAVTADAWPPRRRLPTAGRRNFGAGAWRQLSGQCQAYLVNKRPEDTGQHPDHIHTCRNPAPCERDKWTS